MSYPLDSNIILAWDDPAYRDDAAAELYIESNGPKLTSAHAKLCRALEKQAEKLEEFSNTPFSDDHARLIATTTESLVLVEAQLERWHALIYPNQKRK